MVRYGKMEDIRRLVVNAISMCDAGDLAPVKKLLGSTLLSLQVLKERKKTRKDTERKEGSKSSFGDPRRALLAVEDAMRNEMEKTIRPDEGELING
jgi:hypothetical protein